MKKHVSKKSGVILVITLWVLSFLTVFALFLGYGVRQRILLVRQIERRQTVARAAESGVTRALAVFHAAQVHREKHIQKQMLMNNQHDFYRIDMGGVSVDIAYDVFGKTFQDKRTYYGMMGEESKLNVNTATLAELTRLFQYVLRWDRRRAADLASSIIEWREWGDRRLDGFFSDRYYANLPYPYQPKSDDFEVIDELLLVRGITSEVFEKLLPFVTIHGNGQVNINIAPWHVLVALGFGESTADEILSIRRGPDRIEATKDDVIFLSPEHFQSVMSRRATLSDREIQQIASMIATQKIQTDSQFYGIQVRAQSHDHIPRAKSIYCVYDTENRNFVYWSEQ